MDLLEVYHVEKSGPYDQCSKLQEIRARAFGNCTLGMDFWYCVECPEFPVKGGQESMEARSYAVTARHKRKEAKRRNAG